MIFNIRLGTFGGPMRVGDLLGVANVIEHFRQVENDSSIKFYLEPGSISTTKYVLEFYDWLMYNTDYFTMNRGADYLPWQRVNVWDYRDIAGDLVKIPNNSKTAKKVVVNPLFDAPYNTYRNWSDRVYQEVIDYCESTFTGYELVLVSQKPLSRQGWRNVNDLHQVLGEIMEADTYVGGDTGLSHFAGALERGPDPIYYYSSRSLLHTTPINWHTNKKGTLRTYWLDFENTGW